MKIPDDFIRQITNEADIVDVISNFLNLKKRGRNFISLSPFTNEKTPSFIVSPQKQIFKDFSSGKGGNVITFLMEYEKLTFIEAVQYLANYLNIELPVSKNVNTKKEREQYSKRNKILSLLKTTSDYYRRQLKEGNNSSAIDYLLKRGITEKSQEKFQIGLSPDDWNSTKNFLSQKGFDEKIMIESGVIARSSKGNIFDRFKSRLIFPIRDHLGKVVGFGGREIKGDKNTAKYINSPQTSVYDKSNILYGFFESMDSIRKSEEVIVVEGYMDVISLHQVDINNVVAASGTALTKQQVSKLKRYVNTVYLNYDSDRAGTEATKKAIELCLDQDLEIKVISLPEGEDPDSIVKLDGKKGFDKYKNDSLSFLEFLFRDFKNTNKGSPRERSAFIRKSLNLIDMISDRFVHDYFISELTSLMDMDKEEIEIIYKEKTQISQSQNNGKLELVSSKGELDYDIILRNLKNYLVRSEINIFSLLLKSDDIHNLISRLNLTADFFYTDKAKLIFDHIENIDFQDTSELIQKIIEDEHSDDELHSIITNIMFLEDSFSHSEKWRDYRNIELESNNKEVQEEMILDSIKKIILTNIQDEYDDLIKRIEQEPDNIELLRDLKSLKFRRKEMLSEKDEIEENEEQD